MANVREQIKEYLFLVKEQSGKDYPNISARIENDTELNRIIDDINLRLIKGGGRFKIDDVVNQIEASFYE